MTDIAARARAAAFSIEGKKDGLYQKKGEDWVVRFTIQAGELCDQLRNAPLGTRYQLALVEIGDDEQPINRKEVESGKFGSGTGVLRVSDRPGRNHSGADEVITQPRPVSVSTAQAGARSPAQIAGYLCTLPSFHRFLQEKFPQQWHANYLLGKGRLIGTTTEVAAECVRDICTVESRSEITKDNAEWSALLLAFKLWERHPELEDAR